jgi:Uncharacterized small membrane protein
MKNWEELKNNLMILGALFLFLAVGIGAFGAHGLEKSLSVKAITTFKTRCNLSVLSWLCPSLYRPMPKF